MTSAMDYSLDIETTGLDPMVDRVVTVAMVGNFGDDIHVWDSSEDEHEVLRKVNSFIFGAGIDTFVTWNGSEFDLPFIAVRMVLAGIHGGLVLEPTGAVGKYGKLRYSAHWRTVRRFADIAYDFEDWAGKRGAKWSLNPVAEAAGLGRGIEVDFSTHSILDLTSDQRELYCVSDAQLALGLYASKETILRDISGQAVGLEGSLTIL